MSTDTTIYLMNNLDLGARAYEGETEKEKWKSNESKINWTPIGTDASNVKNKLGKFEGNSHIIKGMYINRENDYNGLFGNANDVLNLTISNSYIQGQNYTGGIVGRSYGITENCHNKSSCVIIEASSDIYFIGGIVGFMSASTCINDCTNTGKIYANKGIGIGGVVGNANASCKITKCTNNGTIISLGIDDMGMIGGIAGQAGNLCEISECNNNASISGNTLRVGGIIGYANQSSTIRKCQNTGEVTGKRTFVGGIAGTVSSLITLEECFNNAKIIGEDSTGGIVGYVSPINTETGLNMIMKNANNGVVIGKEGVGGIIGEIGSIQVSKTMVEKCYNSGEINGVTLVGGITGDLGGTQGQGTIIECYNKGVIKGSRLLGEIIGKEYNTKGLNTLSKLFYLKNDRGLTAVGGENDDKDIKKIIWVTEDLSYEKFKTWITNQ